MPPQQDPSGQSLRKERDKEESIQHVQCVFVEAFLHQMHMHVKIAVPQNTPNAVMMIRICLAVRMKRVKWSAVSKLWQKKRVKRSILVPLFSFVGDE